MVTTVSTQTLNFDEKSRVYIFLGEGGWRGGILCFRSMYSTDLREGRRGAMQVTTPRDCWRRRLLWRTGRVDQHNSAERVRLQLQSHRPRLLFLGNGARVAMKAIAAGFDAARLLGVAQHPHAHARHHVTGAGCFAWQARGMHVKCLMQPTLYSVPRRRWRCCEPLSLTHDAQKKQPQHQPQQQPECAVRIAAASTAAAAATIHQASCWVEC